MTSELIPQLLIYMIVLLFAISAHEAAHAWMSNRFGDDTARLLGRITLNPNAHIDPIGTLLIPMSVSFLGVWEEQQLRYRLLDGVSRHRSIHYVGATKICQRYGFRGRNNGNLFIAICAFIIIKVLLMTGWVCGDS